MTQDELKALVGRAAISYVTPGSIVGVGTGSTVAHFIEALRDIPLQGAVSSSVRSSNALRALGITVFDANDVESLDVYVDGADEIDHHGYMIKGGGAALTREKIVAALAKQFICIADESKLVDTLGAYPLPVEVIPMAAAQVTRRFAALGGTATLRRTPEGDPVITDNGQHLLDVRGLRITDPFDFEGHVSCWAGVVTVGVFAQQNAAVCLLGTKDGVKTMVFDRPAG